MAKTCYIKKDSNPPVCSVHNVALVEHQILIDSNAPDLGCVICYRCPVSQAVVPDLEKDKGVG
jgi:hypothetical protein